LDAMRDSRPSFRSVPRTARTWPHGMLRPIVNASLDGTNRSPESDRRMRAITSSGKCDRLPSVSCLTFAPSR